MSETSISIQAAQKAVSTAADDINEILEHLAWETGMNIGLEVKAIFETGDTKGGMVIFPRVALTARIEVSS
jgi:hypothetical protein